LAVVGDGVVLGAGDHYSLTLLLLEESRNVLLGGFDIFGLAADLNVCLTLALAGDVDGDVEAGLDAALHVTAAANESTMLFSGDVDGLGDLGLPLGNLLLDVGNDLIDDLSSTLNLDGVSISILLGELNGPCEIPAVNRATGQKNEVAEVGTWR
jgi:hypothetical protein